MGMIKGAVAFACVLLAACAGGQARGGSFLDAEGCGQSFLSAPVSQVLLDSAALAERVSTILGTAHSPDTLSFLIQQRPDSSLVSLRATAGVHAEMEAALENAVLAELLPPEGEHGLPPYRILFADQALTLGRVRMCPARLLNRDELVAAMQRAASRMRTEATAIALLSVEASGAVVNIRLLQASGDPNVDAVALAIAGLARFSPALWDGEPIRTAVPLPVGFVVRN